MTGLDHDAFLSAFFYALMIVRFRFSSDGFGCSFFVVRLLRRNISCFLGRLFSYMCSLKIIGFITSNDVVFVMCFMFRLLIIGFVVCG